MVTKQVSTRLSRRRLVRSAAATGAAALVAGGATAVSAPDGSVAGLRPDVTSVSALVVRADHATATPGAMRIGLRASIQGPAIDLRRVVLVVEPISFGAADEVNHAIAMNLRSQVAALLADRGHAVDPQDIAIQLFGANL